MDPPQIAAVWHVIIAAPMNSGTTPIATRIAAVADGGRSGFTDGSPPHDQVTVAIIRAAALFEDERFAPYLASTTTIERRGIAATRKISVHSGYAAMDADTSWPTIVEQLPAFIAKVRAALDAGRQ